jgi:hypothetical protein
MSDQTAGPSTAEDVWSARRSGLARDVDRLVDRLRGLSEARLSAPAPPHDSRAAAARAAAQVLADTAAGLEARADPDPPAWRDLPELNDFAAGDQVAVTGHDLVAAAHEVGPADSAWSRHGRRTARELLDAAVDALADLRRLL